ncbi:TadE/TadG family type IV pilus assembly protein [Elioraea thermophila]|uniref:TadE/TadG family type IV pilus assembly protein n=1 Tax=Elioraea thermophila TaxID=2185104 RepID=UPI001300A307|nr:TadE/TadG family type IV pilus assembly protein [Elioraea thermophila]
MCAERRRQRGLTGAQRGAESGTAAVSFAIVAPVLLTLVFGIIDLARYAFTVVSVREAAAIAVRAAAVGRTEAEAAAIAIGRTPFVANGLDLTIECELLTTANGAEIPTRIACGAAIDPTALRRVRVIATGEFRFLLPYLPTGAIPIVQRTEVTS